MVVLSCVFAMKYKKGGSGGILYGDAVGYYFYLPSAFIYHNLDSINILPKDNGIADDIFAYTNEMAGNNATPTGHVLDQYTFGVAIMEMPFFWAGHLYAYLTGQNTNGFSLCYQNAIRWSSVFYTLLGLLILYKVLRRYFSEHVSIASIFILYIGSNLFWFTTYQGGMSHIPLFFLFSLLMLLTIKLFERPTTMRFLWVGLVCGMITYIRPVDIVCLFIPLLYNVSSKAHFKDRLEFIKTHKAKIALAAFMCFLPWIPQMIYWKMMTGSFLYDSYKGNQTFNFLKPHIWEGIFDASNGWLFYSPALIIFIPGLFLWKRYRSFSWVIFISIPIYMYLIYSWFVPNYINGFGSRPMVDVAAIVALPVAAFVAFIAEKSRGIIIFFSLVMIFCFSLAFNFMIQKAIGVTITDYNNSTFAAQMLFRYNLKYNDLVVNDIGERQPDPKNLKPIGNRIYTQLSDTLQHLSKDSTGNKIYEITAEEEYTPLKILLIYHEKTMKDVHWLKYSGVFKTSDWADIWTCQAFVVTINRNTENLKWRGVRINNKIGRTNTNLSGSIIYEWKLNEWGEVYFYTSIPKNIQEGDEILMQITNSGKKTMQAKDVYAQLFE